MKSISKTLVLFSLIVLSFFSVPLQSVTQAELERFAIRNNDSELIEILMKYKNTPDQPALNEAMYERNYFAVFILVENGVDINSRAKNTVKTALEMAIEFGESSLVEYFLIKNADPTIFRNAPHVPNYATAVHDAIIADRLDFIILFVQYGFDLNKKCFAGTWSPLQLAAQNNRKDIVTFLVSIGAKL